MHTCMRAHAHTHKQREAKGQTDDRETIPVCQPVLKGDTESKFCDYTSATETLSVCVKYDICSILAQSSGQQQQQCAGQHHQYPIHKLLLLCMQYC